MMNRRELVNKIKSDIKRKNNRNLTAVEVDLVIHYLIDNITSVVNASGVVVLKNFGSFSLKSSTPRMAHNINTGEMEQTKRRRSIRFRNGAGIIKQFNNGREL